MSTSCGKLLEQRTRQLQRTLEGVRSGDAAAVHAARIATRRLAELVPVAGVPRDEARPILRRLRKLRRRLSHLRDSDSELLLLDKLLRVGGVSSSYVRRVRDAIRVHDGERSRRRDAKEAAARLKRMLARLGGLVGEVNAGGPARERSFRWATRARVVRRAVQVRRDVKESGALYEPERLHRARVSVKKLRYAVEVANALEADFAADLRMLKRIQGTLGRLNDAEMVLDRVRAVQEQLDADGTASGTDAKRLRAFLETRCRRLHGRFMRERDALTTMCGRLAAPGAVPRAEPRRRAS